MIRRLHIIERLELMPVFSAGDYGKVELRLLEFLKLNMKALMSGSVQVTNIFDEKIT